jgi:hypothetical protein
MNIFSIKSVLTDQNTSLFNVAAWPKKGTKNIILIGRELSQKGTFGEPDIGRLSYMKSTRKMK